MSQKVAAIRPYTPEDEKLVRFTIGKANMELLGAANNRVYRHPLFIAVWIALSAVFVEFAKWWPRGTYGVWEYIKILPALAAVAVPMLFAVDWYHRQEFEDQTRLVLQYPDVRQLAAYYTKSPASGLWILEYGDTFVGFIALDCSQEGDILSVAPLAPKEDELQSKSPPTRSSLSGKTGVIRHFYVSERFRSVGIQVDILEHAIKHAFAKDLKLSGIQGIGFALLPYIGSSLLKAGFQFDGEVKSIGVLGWKVWKYSLSRETWSKQEKTP